MSSKIKEKKDLFKELCETDEDFDKEKIIKERELAKKLRKAVI